MAAKKPSAARIKKLAANPATRAALEDKYLSPAQLKQRQLNQRLDSPVTPGSALTYRDLAHQAQNATTVQYGPARQQANENLQAAQQFQTNMGSWYDQYQKDLQAARDRIAQNNTDANTAFQNLVGAAGKLGTGVEGTNAQGDAANAASVRQQLLGSFAALQNETGKAGNNYAEGLADIVAPGQRVTALSDAGRRVGTMRDRLAELAREEGAFNQKFRTDTISDEAKNALAAAIATGKDTLAQQRIDNQAAAGRATRREQRRHNQAQETAAANDPSKQKTKAELDYFHKHGYWPPTGPPKKPKGTNGGNGPDWLTQQQMGAGLTQLTKLKDFANRAKTGQAFIPGHKPQGRLARADAAKKIFAAAPSLKDPVLLSAALDAVYDQHLSRDTVKRLIAAGYKPSRVAQTLGVPTAEKYKAPSTGTLADSALTSIKQILPGG